MSKVKRLMENFNYYLDDLYGDIKICGVTFSPSDILKEFDPVAYNQEFNHYLDDMNVDLYGEA